MLSNVAKKVAVRKKWRETYHEQDRIVKFIVQSVEGRGDAEPMEHPFRYIITRPSEMIWDRPSRKKLAASKSVRCFGRVVPISSSQHTSNGSPIFAAPWSIPCNEHRSC